MLNTVLFDMGGTLEDIWNNQETQAKAMDALQKTLRAHGLEPGCSPEEFDRRVMAGLKEYKRWSEGLELEKKPEEIWPDYYLKEFDFDREKLIPITEELANLWEVTYYHRELRGDVLETLEALAAPEPPQAVRAAAAPQTAAAARNERRVILRIMFLSSISLRVRPTGTAPESYVLYARLVQSRFTLVKYITHFTVKQLTFALKRPLLSIASNISIDYFDALFRFC